MAAESKEPTDLEAAMLFGCCIDEEVESCTCFWCDCTPFTTEMKLLITGWTGWGHMLADGLITVHTRLKGGGDGEEANLFLC